MSHSDASGAWESRPSSARKSSCSKAKKYQRPAEIADFNPDRIFIYIERIRAFPLKLGVGDSDQSDMEPGFGVKTERLECIQAMDS
jgi:hypothetical protein